MVHPLLWQAIWRAADIIERKGLGTLDALEEVPRQRLIALLRESVFTAYLTYPCDQPALNAQLTDFHRWKLGEAQAVAVEAHVQQCERCRRELEMIGSAVYVQEELHEFALRALQDRQ